MLLELLLGHRQKKFIELAIVMLLASRSCVEINLEEL
jgi:hypothetical protein